MYPLVRDRLAAGGFLCFQLHLFVFFLTLGYNSKVIDIFAKGEMIQMKPILSKPQLGYTKAKRKFEDKSKVLEKRIEETAKLQEVTQEVMEGLVIETGFHDAFNDLRAAEDELIEWSHNTMKHEKTYKDNKQAIDDMYAKLESDPQMRARIIQLAMRVR